jgi:hypothetical protein
VKMLVNENRIKKRAGEPPGPTGAGFWRGQLKRFRISDLKSRIISSRFVSKDVHVVVGMGLQILEFNINPDLNIQLKKRSDGKPSHRFAELLAVRGPGVIIL